MAIGVNLTKKKAETFQTHLSDVFKSHHNIGNQNFSYHIKLSLISPLPLYLTPKLFSPGKIQHYIKSFLLKKSPGLHLIIAEVAPQLSKKALTHLIHILNSIL